MTDRLDEILGKVDKISDHLIVRKSEHDRLSQEIVNIKRDLSDLKIKLFGTGAMTMEQINRKIRAR